MQKHSLGSGVDSEYRIVIFGSAAVGKTSLVLRFIKKFFKESYTPTIEDTYRQVSNTPHRLHTYTLLHHFISAYVSHR